MAAGHQFLELVWTQVFEVHEYPLWLLAEVVAEGDCAVGHQVAAALRTANKGCEFCVHLCWHQRAGTFKAVRAAPGGQNLINIGHNSRLKPEK